MVTFALQ